MRDDFQAETRARSRQTRAVKAATDQIERGVQALRRIESSPFNDGAPCYWCSGEGSVMWAAAHSGPCRQCNGTGRFQEDETFLLQPIGFVSSDNETGASEHKGEDI